jgi:peptide-methionine (S)-S-oxide reductase
MIATMGRDSMTHDLTTSKPFIGRIHRHVLNGGLCLMLALGTTLNVWAGSAEQTAVFAGGCFWGVDAVFKHVKGVSEVVSGYAGGASTTARYDQVSNGDTGHAESVRIRFDPARVTYHQLLHVFFSVAHDPTQRNRQGPDVGTQYRSAVFYTSAEQQSAARSYIEQLNAAQVFSRPIVTQIEPLQQFYPAEAHHQNYLALHPYQPYIVFNDMPKLERLRNQFPSLYQ